MPSVQHKAAVNTPTLAFDNPITAGNLVVVALACAEDPSTAGVDDGLGTVFTGINGINGQSKNLIVFSGIAPVGGAATVTITGSFTKMGLDIAEFSGVTLPIQGFFIAYSSPGLPVDHFPYCYVTADHTIVHTVMASSDNSVVYSGWTGFTAGAQANGNDAIGSCYRLDVPAGSNYDFGMNHSAGSIDDSPLVITMFPGSVESASVGCNNPPEAQVGVAYTHDLSTVLPPGYTVAITSGSLPPGLSMDSAGHVTGTPTTPGTYNFTIAVVPG